MSLLALWGGCKVDIADNTEAISLNPDQCVYEGLFPVELIMVEFVEENETEPFLPSAPCAYIKHSNTPVYFRNQADSGWVESSLHINVGAMVYLGIDSEDLVYDRAMGAVVLRQVFPKFYRLGYVKMSDLTPRVDQTDWYKNFGNYDGIKIPRRCKRVHQQQLRH